MDAFGIENHGYSPLISQKYVVKGDFEVYDGMDLLHHAMLNTLPNINKDGGKDEHGKTIRIPDFEARQKADTLITEIRQAFVEWLHAQPDDFKERLTDLYNRNSTVMSVHATTAATSSFRGSTCGGWASKTCIPAKRMRSG